MTHQENMKKVADYTDKIEDLLLAKRWGCNRFKVYGEKFYIEVYSLDTDHYIGNGTFPLTESLSEFTNWLASQSMKITKYND